MATTAARCAAGLVLALVLASADPVAAGTRNPFPLAPVAAHRGTIVVKYSRRVAACAHCLLAQGLSFASVTGRDSLDRLNRRLGVRAAHPLFFEQHDLSPGRDAAYLRSLAAIRDRSPRRAARVAPNTPAPDLSNVYVLELSDSTDVEQAAALYAGDPDVEYAQPDYRREATYIPDDPYFSSSGTWGQSYDDLWGLKITQASTAWDTSSGNGIVVAVVDTGVDYNHPDLAANIWQNPGDIPNDGTDNDGNGLVDDVLGWDFVDNDNTPYDLNGHGTHVAGIIAAAGNNQRGVVGMGWQARIMSVRGLDAQGYGWNSDLAKAILYAAQNGADVINCSFGGYGAATGVLRDAVDTAVGLGVVVVAAAGNNGGSADWFMPAAYPNVIAVGATGPVPSDTHASFSNYGNVLSVSAPGVDVLSLKSAVNKLGSSQVVGTDYLRLSGTSMAAPHVTGIAADLLAAQPTLTPEEVRWHLELNADQPGYTGYEGQPWNPYFGWGRVNAAQVFNLPPVTTRLQGAADDLHAFTGDIVPDMASATLSFTTLDPVDWTVSTPAWFPATSTAGTGPAQLAFSADATGLAPGSYGDSVTVSAPGATDGGGSFPVSLTAHSDTRIGAAISLTNDFPYSGGLTVAADGIGTMIVRDSGSSVVDLITQRVDAGGNVSPPTVVDSGGPYRYNRAALAFDGRNYLVVWVYHEHVLKSVSPRDVWVSTDTVKALRLSSSGAALDSSPLILGSLGSRTGFAGIDRVGVGFDGTTYTVYWQQINIMTDHAKVYTQQVGADGTLRGKRRKIYPNPTTQLTSGPWLISPVMACAKGQCLLVWGVRTGAVDPGNYYVDQAYGVWLQDGALAGVPFQILSDINVGAGWPTVGTNGAGYIVAGTHLTSCPGSGLCGVDLLAARVTADGTVLDGSGIQLNNGTLATYPGSPQITFDGTNYVLIFFGSGSDPRAQVFAALVDPDGTVIDSERPGLLLKERSIVPGDVSGAFASVSPGLTQSTLTWVDTIDFNTYTSPIFAQRILPHSAPAQCPTLPIGSIGPQSVPERTTLNFILSAPGLDPQATIFSGSNLPPGAILDPTGILRWMPAANEAGLYPGVHFSATDGVNSVNEDVSITVPEANLSIGGTVKLIDGSPAVGVTIKLFGMPGGARKLSSDAAGRFHFDDLVPGTYRVRLAPPSTRAYSLSPVRVVLGGVDITDLVLVVSAKA